MCKRKKGKREKIFKTAQVDTAVHSAVVYRDYCFLGSAAQVGSRVLHSTYGSKELGVPQ